MNRHQYHAVLNKLVKSLLPQWIDYYREATDNAEQAAERFAEIHRSQPSISSMIDRQNAEVAANCYHKVCTFLEDRLQSARRELNAHPEAMANRKKEAMRLYNFLLQFWLSAQTWGLSNELPAIKSVDEQIQIVDSLKQEDYPEEVWGVFEAGRVSSVLAAQIYSDFQRNILEYIRQLDTAIHNADRQ